MKEKIFKWIDDSVPLAVELQGELTRRPAVSPDSGGEGELEKCEFLEGWLKAHGITQLERFDAPDKNAKGGVRPNLVATIPGKGNAADGRLWIMSHLDVVPPGEASHWESDPWTMVETKEGPLGHRVIGRGVEDNQQGLVSSVLAALALVKQGLQPCRDVKLLFVADEEMGNDFGIAWLLEKHGNLFQKNDTALVPDWGDTKGQGIEVAEKNMIWVRFTTTGKQTHGSRPDLGANAFLAGSDLALRLHQRLSEKFNGTDSLFEPEYSTFQPTKKEANVPNINTIPGGDVFYIDMRVLPRYSIKEVLNEINIIKEEVAAKHKVAIDCSVVQSNESPATSAEAPFIKFLSLAIKDVYGETARPIGIGGGTVASFLRKIGIDSAVWARLSGTAHQPNEYALVKDIIGDAKVMALLMWGEAGTDKPGR
jgi:succinyl-diaminopimelate desuccinylase